MTRPRCPRCGLFGACPGDGCRVVGAAKLAISPYVAAELADELPLVEAALLEHRRLNPRQRGWATWKWVAAPTHKDPSTGEVPRTRRGDAFYAVCRFCGVNIGATQRGLALWFNPALFPRLAEYVPSGRVLDHIPDEALQAKDIPGLADRHSAHCALAWWGDQQDRNAANP